MRSVEHAPVRFDCHFDCYLDDVLRLSRSGLCLFARARFRDGLERRVSNRVGSRG